MKKIPCSGPVCDQRRIHHEEPDVMRPRQTVEVPDDYEGKAFCSYTCAAEAGYFNVKTGWIKDPAKD